LGLAAAAATAAATSSREIVATEPCPVGSTSSPDVWLGTSQCLKIKSEYRPRRAIFERLCRDGEQTVGALTARAGVSQPAVSKHLGILKQAGLVRDRHEGRQTHYSAQLGALAPLIDWASQMAGFWQRRFDHLEDLLKRMDQ
jgi:DNA-binding transcriptional ArsR family regulator